MKPTKRQWIFQAWMRGGSGLLQTCPEGWLSQCSQMRKRSMWSGWDDHKEASGLDLLPFSPWRTRSVWVSQDTAASSGSSEEQNTVQGEWCLAPWAPPLSPTLPLPPCPAPCLTSGTLPHDRRFSCTALRCGSYSCSLCSHHRKSVGIAWSWHRRSTLSSCPCRDLLIYASGRRQA